MDGVKPKYQKPVCVSWNMTGAIAGGTDMSCPVCRNGSSIGHWQFAPEGAVLSVCNMGVLFARDPKVGICETGI
jgi:hypothetical protein